MELICCERLSTDCNRAERDRVLFEDARVILNLLEMEMAYVPRCDYFDEVQTDILPHMRKIVTTWMLEVCEEQRCEDQVFPLSVNFLDRFLCECRIGRNQLQLVAAVCLLLASKTRQCHPLSVELLCHYTDYSVTTDEIRQWEILVLAKLQWNVTAVTGFDYVDHVVARIPWSPDRAAEQIRRHSHTLVSVCYTEYDFMRVHPSLLATAGIGAAIRGLRGNRSALQVEAAVRSVLELTRVPLEQAEALICRIEQIVAAETAVLQQMASGPVHTKDPSAPASKVPPSPPSPSELDPLENLTQPETPTDIQDVHF